MYEYELQQMRAADLIRRAEHERLVREAARAARRETAVSSAEHESHSRRSHRPRSARAT
ncbi:hypothetical protein [Streptomyces lomondensis]|uniref:Uncharacterized protein n=1 Tax=Streptomyces lomondensis TaxID=68229 RepID=A0ABQ2XLZ0_9ACTN|nr:hypothetical protein [Streptomyces lomondensis]MCF0079283.1 hypothetical protein [Streptomyces lomondensis]GGX21130.1 hypothetical protein GCM10010383_59030 [Streptomyces lomondensis]